MTEDMVERVARAIEAEPFFPRATHRERMARAAIGAMSVVTDERLRLILRDVRANFWVGRIELQGQQQFLDTTWAKVKAADDALNTSYPLEGGSD